MATEFSANPEEAARVSADLSRIRATMNSIHHVFDRYDGATGSGRIERALDEFHAESSDNRKKMNQMLGRAAGLLGALADGTRKLDAGLRQGLEGKGG